ncbi:hypothetical protein [Streptomyces marianii]|uniref:Fibronectin type III domain-containing protein n=1 Tax=Streptomyces marianii TaxID=1817406 RepID=A0A5R9E0I6_9ACTN|nr:hypothetical protein [Streptomyces marianii]TLQ42917.1 hypothetical protein FEF34_06900 [Streptomyces marianii]
MRRPLFFPVLTCARVLLVAACGGGAGAADTRSPSVRSGVTVQASSATSVHVMWEHSTDDTGVGGYEVHRAGTKVTSFPAATRMTDIDTPADGRRNTWNDICRNPAQGLRRAAPEVCGAGTNRTRNVVGHHLPVSRN